MTYLEKFEEIKAAIGTPDVSGLTENFAVQINMTDADCGGAFYIAYRDGALAVEPYDYYDHTAMISATAEDLIGVISGKLDPVKAVLGGRISVEGNLEHIKAIAALKKPAKKPAAKRTCKKTETAKKPAAKRTCKKTEPKA